MKMDSGILFLLTMTVMTFVGAIFISFYTVEYWSECSTGLTIFKIIGAAIFFSLGVYWTCMTVSRYRFIKRLSDIQ